MTTRRGLHDPTDPTNMPASQRLAEVAAILAAGVIRMRAGRAVALPRVRRCRNSARSTVSRGRQPTSGVSENSSESGETRLEVSHRSRPDGQRG